MLKNNERTEIIYWFFTIRHDVQDHYEEYLCNNDEYIF